MHPVCVDELAAALTWRALLAPHKALWPARLEQQYRVYFAQHIKPAVVQYEPVTACVSALSALLVIPMGGVAEAVLQLATILTCNLVGPWVARRSPQHLDSVFTALGLGSAAVLLAMGLGLLPYRLIGMVVRAHPLGGPLLHDMAVLITLAPNRHVSRPGF